MTKLTKAQMALLVKINTAGSYVPFSSEWTSFYVLKRRELARTAGGYSVVLTDAGRAALAATPKGEPL